MPESTCSINNPQAEVLRNYFYNHLNFSMLTGDVRTQQKLTQEKKMFEDIYIHNRKISATGVLIE